MSSNLDVSQAGGPGKLCNCHPEAMYLSGFECLFKGSPWGRESIQTFTLTGGTGRGGSNGGEPTLGIKQGVGSNGAPLFHVYYCFSLLVFTQR